MIFYVLKYTWTSECSIERGERFTKIIEMLRTWTDSGPKPADVIEFGINRVGGATARCSPFRSVPSSSGCVFRLCGPFWTHGGWAEEGRAETCGHRRNRRREWAHPPDIAPTGIRSRECAAPQAGSATPDRYRSEPPIVLSVTLNACEWLPTGVSPFVGEFVVLLKASRDNDGFVGNVVTAEWDDTSGSSGSSATRTPLASRGSKKIFWIIFTPLAGLPCSLEVLRLAQ